MKGLTLTVTQLNEYVRRSLAADPMLRGLCIVGELSNFKRHASGHWYFSLKDQEAAISCAMFRQSTMGVRFHPENGQRVRLYGSVGLYSKTGSYQFYADAMEPDGVGDLYLRFEALKRRLTEEGLFDASLKKPLPLLPGAIGVVTSKTGAVIHDIARVTERRFPGMAIILCPVKVQGDGAAEEIAAGIATLDRLPQVDTIIVGRGGGSMEDLWAFNEEAVARAIAQCRTPVVSAVGHETDFTIADFVADVRAATPSAAAELAVPLKETLLGEVSAQLQRAEHAWLRALNEKGLQLSELKRRLIAASPAQMQQRMAAALAAATLRLQLAAQHALEQKEHRLGQTLLRMRTAGPMETMRRGYAVVLKNGKALRSVTDATTGEPVTLRLADGTAQATVTAVLPDERK